MQNIVEVIKAKKARIEKWHKNCLKHLDEKIRMEAFQRDRFVKVLCQDLEGAIDLLKEVDSCRKVSLEQFEKFYQEADDIDLVIDGYFVKFAILTNPYDFTEEDLERMASNEPPIDSDEEIGVTRLGIIYVASDSVIKKEV